MLRLGKLQSQVEDSGRPPKRPQANHIFPARVLLMSSTLYSRALKPGDAACTVTQAPAEPGAPAAILAALSAYLQGAGQDMLLHQVLW